MEKRWVNRMRMRDRRKKTKGCSNRRKWFEWINKQRRKDPPRWKVVKSDGQGRRGRSSEEEGERSGTALAPALFSQVMPLTPKFRLGKTVGMSLLFIYSRRRGTPTAAAPLPDPGFTGTPRNAISINSSVINRTRCLQLESFGQGSRVSGE